MQSYKISGYARTAADGKKEVMIEIDNSEGKLRKEAYSFFTNDEVMIKLAEIKETYIKADWSQFKIEM